MKPLAKTNRHLSLFVAVKKIWDEFVYSSGLVVLGDVLALYVISSILNIDITASFIVVIILSIFTVNLFNRYKEAAVDGLSNAKRSDSVSKYFKYMPHILCVSVLVSAGITAYYAPIGALIVMVVLFGLGIFYTLFLKKVTRKILGFKNFMTALPYSFLVIFLALYHNTPITLALYLIAIFYFLRIFINTSYFDIKDIESDSRQGLKTFPVVYGESKTKKFLLVLNFVSVVPIILGVYLDILPLYSLGLLVTTFYGLLYLSNAKISNKNVLYNVVVDSEFIFWLPYIIIFRAALG